MGWEIRRTREEIAAEQEARDREERRLELLEEQNRLLRSIDKQTRRIDRARQSRDYWDSVIGVWP
jgi:hypothetical protein